MAEVSASVARPLVRELVRSDSSSIVKLTTVLASAFMAVPMSIGFICDEQKIKPPYPSPALDFNRFYENFGQKIRKIAKSDATLLQGGDWSAIAIWEPPNYIDPRAGDGQDPNRVLFGEWRARLKVVKEKYLAKPVQTIPEGKENSTVNTSSPFRPYYHLAFLARNPNIPSVPGAISVLLEPFLQRARDEMIPAWLEASSPHAAGVYEYFGFRVVEVINFGIGKYGPDGWPSEGGEGISAYPMIFDAHLTN